jgi:predicted transposase/invertase (TIGR01784 family)
MERLNPLNDYLFMKTFGEKGDEEQLLAFLKSILKRTKRDNIVSVEILEDKTLTAEVIGDKTSILDVRARTDKGDYINIEVQLKDMHNIDKRSVFYWGKQYVKNMNSGDVYTDLPNVISINIVNFDFIPLDDFQTSFHLREDRNHDCILTDAIEIHFINMVKFRRLKNKDIKNNILQRWLTFLDETTPPEIIEEVVKMDTAINRTNDRITFLSQDKETMHRYSLRQMGMMDWNSVINDRNQAEQRAKQEYAARIQAENRAGQEYNARMQAETALAEANRLIAELQGKQVISDK